MINGHTTRLLALLARSEHPLTLTTLADKLHITRPQASRLANQMVDRKLLSRKGSQADLRIVLFALTAEGRRTLDLSRKA